MTNLITLKLLRNGGWEKYVDHGIWIGKGNKSCTDPKYIHASLMINPEEIIHGIQYIDFEENESNFYECKFILRKKLAKLTKGFLMKLL